ncbi:senescence associated gene 18 [Prunus dulcis]|uniref:Senescence associated gene 18 n=1 Tax=Prunus dulcis TaxID=3755 RepID=A0A4Y1QWC3_PRUDU|nr:senescence associated gene 18 [Prunus dulcis]
MRKTQPNQTVIPGTIWRSREEKGNGEEDSVRLGVAILCFVVLMIVTPAIPQSEAYHDFADQRDLQGELWGWTCFYIGVAAVAIGSSYYHLKPNDARLVWDRLPMTIAFTSIIAIFIIERIDERKGTISIIPLLLAGIISILFFDDLRPYAMVQFLPCIAIPLMAILLPPMYTHSTYWLWAAGFYLLAKVEEAADKVIYDWTHHIVSGHTLKHLCAAMVPVFLTLMLAKRTVEPASGAFDMMPSLGFVFMDPPWDLLNFMKIVSASVVSKIYIDKESQLGDKIESYSVYSFDPIITLKRF